MFLQKLKKTNRKEGSNAETPKVKKEIAAPIVTTAEVVTEVINAIKTEPKKTNRAIQLKQ